MTTCVQRLALVALVITASLNLIYATKIHIFGTLESHHEVAVIRNGTVEARGTLPLAADISCGDELRISYEAFSASAVTTCTAAAQICIVGMEPTGLALSCEALNASIPDDSMDRAIVRVSNAGNLPFTLRSASAECFHCLLPVTSVLQPLEFGPAYMLLSTKYETILAVDTVISNTSRQALGDRDETWTLASEARLPDDQGSCGTNSALHCTALYSSPTARSAPFLVARFAFQQGGVYDLIVTGGANQTVAIHAIVTTAGDSATALYRPLWVLALVLLCSAILYAVGGKAILYCSSEDEQDDFLTSDSVHVNDQAVRSGKPNSKQRVKSIDVFRGAALTIMVAVNYGGAGDAAGFGGYWFLDHSTWDGLTVADLVFPWFLWTMGVSLSLSLSGQRRRGASRWAQSWKLLTRAAKLFVLGVAIIDNASDMSNARIPGVLQYFAAATVLVGLSEVWLPTLPPPCPRRSSSTPSSAQRETSVNRATAVPGFAHSSLGEPLIGGVQPAAPQGGQRGACAALGGATLELLNSFVVHAPQFLLFGAVLAVYLLIQQYLPVPGCPTGYIGPGGLGDFGRYPHCTGGAHRYIDLQLWGLRHMFHSTDASNVPISGATCADVYQCAVYDPEGTLGTLTACLMAFLGLHAGRILVKSKAAIAERRQQGTDEGEAGERLAYHAPVLLQWLLLGLLTGLIGAALTGFGKHGGLLPISKNLWSPSFVFALSGLAFLSVAALYIVVDVWHLWQGEPFVYIGSNSTIVYVGSEVLQYYFPFTPTLHPPVGGYGGQIFKSHTGAVVSNSIGVATWALIAYLMFRNKFFVTL